MKPFLQPRAILTLSLLAATGSLAAAYTAQYAFHLAPCHLCLAQRAPFALIILLAAAGFVKPRWRVMLIALIAAFFLIDSGIAAYHTAVEQHWVPGPDGCTQEEAPPGQSPEDFLKRIQSAPIVACDTPMWDFHGITMAQMNAVWCLFLSAATFAALQHNRKKEKTDA